MKYVGVTIGPIFKTIKLAISPVGLWFASGFFSEYTRRLCSKLTNQVSGISIFSPYFDGSNQYDGIGKYHDRILFSCPELSQEELQTIIDEIKVSMVDLLELDGFSDADKKDFLSDYLQISFCIFEQEELEGKNLVFSLNNALDALELMTVSHQNQPINFFEKIFVGKDGSRNSFIKDSKLFKDITSGDNFLWNKNEGRFRSIEDIAQGNQKNSIPYFAIVNSDGDKVGKLLKSICFDEETALPLDEQVEKIKDFSRCCLDYSAQAAKIVNDCGGMTIYAGGDDLLFLSPVESILSLSEILQATFKQSFGSSKYISNEEIEKLAVSLSFGASVHYVKFPLYETLEEASNLMYAAKNLGGNKTNISVTKHSGQSTNLVIRNSQATILKQLIDDVRLSDDTVQSILYKIGQLEAVFEELFKQAIQQNWDSKTFFEIFSNNFDNINQAKYMGYIQKICDFYYQNYLFDAEIKEHVGQLQSSLRLLKFWTKGE